MRLEITDWFDAPVELPPEAQEFAIGDVHGQAVHMGVLLDAMRARAGDRAWLTLLGDLVDRGPASLAALRLAAADGGFAGQTTLLGNHEIQLLLATGGSTAAPDALDLWLDNGGGTTLAEAGVSVAALGRGVAEAAAAFRLAAGARAMAMLEAAPLARQVGNLVFVHAGVDPAVPLDRFLAAPRLVIDNERHPAWIREPFLLHEGRVAGERIVVHGHTPENRVLALKNRGAPAGHHRLDGWRLGLDGGSTATGIVAGAEFRRGGYRVFTAATG